MSRNIITRTAKNMMITGATSTPLCLAAMSSPVAAPVVTRYSRVDMKESKRRKSGGLDAVCSGDGTVAVMMACQRRTGDMSQKRERTVSDVMRPPCAIREGSNAHCVQATAAATAEAAIDDALWEGAMEMKAKKAMRPVENTMMPLHTCRQTGVSRQQGERGCARRTAMPRRPS